MKRREFILLLGGAAAWPIAEQPERMRWIGEFMAEQRAVRRVGVLLPGAPADSGHFASAFLRGLPATSTARTSPSNTVGPRAALSDYRSLPLSLSRAASLSSPLAARRQV